MSNEVEMIENPLIENPSKRDFVEFQGYYVMRSKAARVINKKTMRVLKHSLRKRKGGKFDPCVTLYYNGKRVKWTLSRLRAACFLGPIDGYQINHKDRDPMNLDIDNLERVSASYNQKHWRSHK